MFVKSLCTGSTTKIHDLEHMERSRKPYQRTRNVEARAGETFVMIEGGSEIDLGVLGMNDVGGIASK